MKMKHFLAGMILGVLAIMPLSAASAQSPSTFNDVPLSHPNFEAITDLKTRGIIDGYPDGSFKPEQAVNRVEALKIITLGAELEPLPRQDGIDAVIADFSDIDQNAWYMQYLNRAVTDNIVTGYPDGSFKPEQTVNLVENLKMLLLANSIDTSATTVSENPYADTPKDEWYAKYVMYAKEKNLIGADPQNNVFPAQGMTRAKLAETMYRLIYINEHQLDMYPPPEMRDDQGLILAVNIDNFAFSPKEMTIAAGTTVRWTNKDSTAHTVTSDEGTTLSSPSLGKDDTYEHTFNEEGTFSYHCALHSFMPGKIIVKPANEVPTI